MIPISSTAARNAALCLAFRQWFGITRGSAAVLAHLFQAEEPMMVDRLAVASNLTEFTVHRWAIPLIRQCLETEAVEGDASHGYRLTEIGRDECCAALRTLGAEMLGAA